MPWTPTHFGLRMKAARLAKNLTQLQLGQRIGLHVDVAATRIQRYENAIHQINWELLDALSETLDVPVSYFFAQDVDEAQLLILWHRKNKSFV